MKAVLRLLFRYLFQLKMANFERIVFNGPTIILPNHVSFLDAVFLYLFLPDNVYFVVNTAIAKRFAIFLRKRNYVTVDPLNPYSIKKIVEVVRLNQPVVLFPEGRITTTGGLMKVYSGVGFIALKTGATIYPLIFSGPEYSKLSRLRYKVRTRWFPQVSIYVDKPIVIGVDRSKSFKLQKQEISNKILTLLQQAMFQAKEHWREATNLFDQLGLAGVVHGVHKVMAEDIGGAVTYKQGMIGSYVLGRKLAGLLQGEERVGVLLPNSIGHLVTLFGLFYLGKTPAILNFSAGLQNNLDCAQTAEVKSILTSRLFVEKAGFGDLISHLAAIYRIIYLEDVKATITIADKVRGYSCYLRGDKAFPGQVSRLVLFTSGSESKPKGVVLNHSNIMANINQISCVIDYTHQDKMLNALPMFHSFGLTAGTLLPILSGVEVFLYPSPLHYKVVPEIAYDRNASILLGTPTFLMGYAKYANSYDFYRIRYVLAGGEKLKDDVRSIWLDKFGLRILEGYGTTETGPVLSLNTPLFYRKGTVGKFLPGISWQTEEVEGISEGGNLLVKGPNVMEGYLLYGTGFVPAEQWYNCGDVVSVDADGFITIKARVKRFAKISGEMVSLDLVEQLAQACFGTDKNAAINISDEKKGERIVLFTMHKTAAKQQLREFLSQSRHGMLLMPAEIIVVDKIPLLGSGKADYVALKAAAGKEQGDAKF